MKRLWLGVGILLVILGLGIFSAAVTEAFQKRVSRELILAAEAAGAGEWDTAQSRYHQAKELWEENRACNAAITDHAPMEEIDRYFSQGSVFLSEGNRKDFRSCCLALSVLVEAVAEAQGLTWWSLL